MKWLWLLFFCKHENTRCIHGDEIIARNWRRILCMDCGGALDGPLPRRCHTTGLNHLSAP